MCSSNSAEASTSSLACLCARIGFKEEIAAAVDAEKELLASVAAFIKLPPCLVAVAVVVELRAPLERK
jgi:hypothetical protein